MDDSNELKRKYEILPGVSVPDMKTLAEASENYETVGVDDFEIKSVPRFMEDGKPDVATAAELAQLKALGVEVAEIETRQNEESRKRMESIMHNAVSAPSTLNDLKKDAAKKMSEEKKKELEAAEAEAKKDQAILDKYIEYYRQKQQKERQKHGKH